VQHSAQEDRGVQAITDERLEALASQGARELPVGDGYPTDHDAPSARAAGAFKEI
jgi:hypothetical protein